MKKLNSILAFVLLFALPFAFNACKDEVKPDAPTVVAPSVVTAVQAGASSDITFTVTIPGGYKSSAVTGNGGTATIKTDGTPGATTASVIVTFTAGATAGPGSVSLTATDNNGKVSSSATAVLSVTIPGSPTVTAPTANTLASTNTAVDITFPITVPGGYKTAVTSAVTPTGSTATIKSAPAVGATSGNVVVTYTPGTTLGNGSVTLTVTDNSGLSSFASATTTVGYVEITGAITATTTWPASKKYLLKGNVYVRAGVELTIEAGTIILGDKVTKGALIINRGAKIHAIGTAAKPIIFTSSAPKGFRNYGDWGGLVILGKAANNQSGNQNIEGITATGTEDGVHGNGATADGSGNIPVDATTDADNSGELQYARIEFAGIALSTDNELNGLTMGSVGSGTKIDHIQVSYSGDDSYEWFGGTVNGRYLIAYRGWDDEFDTDFGYRGSNQFLVSYRDPNIADKSGSNGFESDNNAQGNNQTPQTAAIFSNVTFFGPYMYANLQTTSSAAALNPSSISSNYKRGAHIRRNTALKVYNSVFAGANIDGVLFDKASAGAEFKGNYIARISGSAKPTVIANDFAGSTTYNDANFAADNTIVANAPAGTSISSLSDVFAGGSINSPSGSAAVTNALWNLASPSALLASGSSLLTGFVTPSASTTGFTFQTVGYRGAFDATNNWASSTWTNYDPNNTEY